MPDDTAYVSDREQAAAEKPEHIRFAEKVERYLRARRLKAEGAPLLRAELDTAVQWVLKNRGTDPAFIPLVGLVKLMRFAQSKVPADVPPSVHAKRVAEREERVTQELTRVLTPVQSALPFGQKTMQEVVDVYTKGAKP